jgi:hypothetical protein
VLLYLLLQVPLCRVVAQFQPDLAWWLGIVAVLAMAKAAVELVVAKGVIQAIQRRT